MRWFWTAAPGALLIAAACLATAARAQTTFQFPDPLAPKLQTDPKKPPRFQKPAKPGTAQFGPPPTFAPASGAGKTGFDSSNTRKKNAARKPNAAADKQAIAPGLPQPLTLTPGQKPASAAFAQAPAAPPGEPPVEIGPIRKPPPKRKAHVEPPDPYAQLGLRAGAFDLYPAIEFIGGYATNPGAAPDPHGAALYTIAPELRVQSNWSRHELKADLRGSYTGYSPDETPTLSRPYFNGKVDGRIDVRDSTRVDLGSRVLVATDNPGSPNLQAGLSKLPVFATFGGNAGVTQRFNRVEVTLKGDVERTAYQDSQLTDGTTASNEDRNYNQYTGTLRGAYELSPGIKPFVEIGADTRKHDLATDLNGFQRNSRGLVGSVGSTFELTRLLTGEASIGYTTRSYDDPRFDRLKGLTGSASLIWTADALNTVKFTATSTVGESNIPGVPGVFYRDAGVQWDHSFRRWLVGTVKLGIGQDLYEGTASSSGDVAGRTDNRYSAGAGLTYKIDRTMQLRGEFQQQWLRSNVSGVDYTASTFLIGLRLQR
ncbi:MAG TPA: outer membrane beta-barrel protein [Pseudolabrys sp.]|nr:outer membrane beta-barrel protein [Pseudolabrys sp.]